MVAKNVVKTIADATTAGVWAVALWGMWEHLDPLANLKRALDSGSPPQRTMATQEDIPHYTETTWKTRGAKHTKKKKRRGMIEGEKVEQQRKAKATKDHKKKRRRRSGPQATAGLGQINPRGSQQPPTATT
eukprot:scaffold452_cov163-Skeletonema_marinoi.AAC.6